MASKSPTDDAVKSKAHAPPAVITVDTEAKEAVEGTPSKIEAEASSQARTPKHANKVRDEEKKEEGADSDGKAESSQPRPPGGNAPWNGHPPPNYSHGSYPPSFENRLGGSGAFEPRDRHGYPGHPSQPRGYYQQPPSYGHGPPPPPGPPRYAGPYDQRYPPDYPRYDHPHPPGPGPSYGHRFPGPPGPPPPMYQYPGGAYENAGRPPWGAPVYPQGPPGRPPMNPHSRMSQDHHGPPRGPAPTNSNTFSRAVSHSFDRSVRSRDGKHTADGAPAPPNNPSHQPAGDSGSVGEDASWKLLNQVHSVDEDEMRRRSQKRETPEAGNKEVDVKPPSSNSSSLTNSPTEGVESKKAATADPAKLSSSLDSLSSVASEQEPMHTAKKGKGKAPSPRDSPGSLDLMKCASGSSALLLPAHQRSLSQFSFPGSEHAPTGKRPLDEEREDVDTEKEGNEIRKAASEDGRPAKKGRVDSFQAKKGSPLSITCSPPNSPSGEKRKANAKLHQPTAMYPNKEGSPKFFDKQYAYRTDSRLDHRPGSSSSSTITPMNVEGGESRQPEVGQAPSWELHGQDSFGGASVGTTGNPLNPSFSFPHDYPMLQSAESMDNGFSGPGGESRGHQDHRTNPALESRNQSFDGGHYHGGGIGRTDSMMSYESRGPSYDGRPPYQGPFPPHAPSWGSAQSYPGHAYGAYRGNYPGMRNYSEDSGGRTSPPSAAHPGMRMLPPNFQPPANFQPPPSMVSKSGPQNTIIASPYQPTAKVGAYGWSKEEDARLTDIMKKYKNPRDWEPITKEHNHGRSAKECHERWIRYLKPGVRKGQWTDHEDAIVMEAVTTSTEQPFTRWSDLAQRLPGRVGKQIRDRWVNHLNPNINHLPFSREDDLLLWDGHKKLGKRWVEISTKYFNSSRSENHIKNRWYSASFKKFISNEFGPDAYNGGKEKKSSPEKKKKPSSPRRRGGGDSSQIEVV